MQDRAWQTGRAGDTEVDKGIFAISRLWPVRRGYLTRELRTLMWEKGEQTRVTKIAGGDTESRQRLARPSHSEKEILRGYSSPTPSQLASPPQRPGEFLTPQSRGAGQSIVRRTGGALRVLFD